MAASKQPTYSAEMAEVLLAQQSKHIVELQSRIRGLRYDIKIKDDMIEEMLANTGDT